MVGSEGANGVPAVGEDDRRSDEAPWPVGYPHTGADEDVRQRTSQTPKKARPCLGWLRLVTFGRAPLPGQTIGQHRMSGKHPVEVNQNANRVLAYYRGTLRS